MRVTVIRNPVSGRGAGARRWPEALRLLGNAFPPASIQVLDTTGPGSAKTLAGEAVARSDLVVAAGGDGTLSQVMNGLFGTGVTMGVLPMGTGNDFCRTLGVGTSLELAVSTLAFGAPAPIDLIRWTLDTGESGLLMNVGGCGFDAVVAERINRGYKRLRGTAAYLASVVQTLASYRATPVRLSLDGATTEYRAMLCAVANAQCYGGGMRVAPNARFDDGLIDVVVVSELSKLAFLRAFPRVFKGSHLSHPAVRSLQGRTLRIESSPALPVLADGEIIGKTPVTFEILPGALTVMAPVDEGAKGLAAPATGT